MGRVNVDGVGIEYDVTGEGPPVVLLHGFPTPAGSGGTRRRRERLDGPGHWMQLDAPDQVNALLLDFLPR